jgi:glycosyltransferase involved in cell wall biosynthesis
MTDFSVLMSIYYKETADNLNQCLESLASQTLQAAEIVIVKDGKLTDGLEECLVFWKNKLPLKMVGYEENRGLAFALNYGLEFVSCDLVARMDSDDICLPDRFEKQIAFLKENNASIVGSDILEFYDKKL